MATSLPNQFMWWRLSFIAISTILPFCFWWIMLISIASNWRGLTGFQSATVACLQILPRSSMDWWETSLFCYFCLMCSFKYYLKFSFNWWSKRGKWPIIEVHILKDWNVTPNANPLISLWAFMVALCSTGIGDMVRFWRWFTCACCLEPLFPFCFLLHVFLCTFTFMSKSFSFSSCMMYHQSILQA